MADRGTRVRSEFHIPSGQSDNIISSADQASRILNMISTLDGALISIAGPCPLLPLRSVGNEGLAPPGDHATGTLAVVAGLPTLNYGPVHGIVHATLREGTRHVLLAHVGDELWEFQGWKNAWRTLQSGLPNPTHLSYPTKFEIAPNGIIICPQNSRAFFYDGTIILSLGYSTAPSSPQAFGPGNTSDIFTATTATTGQNDRSYAHDSLQGRPTGMNPMFQFCRLGTVSHPTNWSAQYTAADKSKPTETAVVAGWLEPGAYRAKVQYIDTFGNLSPLSGPSQEVRWTRQVATKFDSGAAEVVIADHLVNSGSASYYEVPLDSETNAQAFATLPDNESEIYPDNIPDGWLGFEPEDVIAVPQFSICCLAFGRLFIAIDGMIRWSIVGLYGTFKRNDFLVPDPNAQRCTGIWKCKAGVLVFTKDSTYLVRPNDTGDGFVHQTISSQEGMIAPASLATLPNGDVIGLGQHGFNTVTMQQNGVNIQSISIENRRSMTRISSGAAISACADVDPETGEYRCWVPRDGSRENSICYIYSGGWRERNDVRATCVTRMRDHHKQLLVGGRVDGVSGIWVLDRESAQIDYRSTRTAEYHSVWIGFGNQDRKKSYRALYLTMLDGGSGELTVEISKNYQDQVDYSQTIDKSAPTYASDQWGTIKLDSDKYWAHARIFTVRVDVAVSSVESMKFRIKGTGKWGLLGYRWEESPRGSAGSRMQ